MVAEVYTLLTYLLIYLTQAIRNYIIHWTVIEVSDCI